MQVAKELARFVASHHVPDEALERAAPLVLDTLAVMLAGGREPGVELLASTLAVDRAPGRIPSFWSDAGYRSDDAALLFGTASHVLDYDDVSMLAMCHPSTPVLSALLARPLEGVSGRRLLEAYAVGTEVLIRVGQAMGFRHYALGFHATATLGTLGSAAACARLAGLDEARTAHAIAIAASMASGLRRNFGSMVKSLHVGLAARNGVTAAGLASAGLDGADNPMEREGFLHAFSGGETDRFDDSVVLGAPFALVHPGFEQKRYPCCYMLHKMVEATLHLRRTHVLALEQVASVEVDMPPGGTKPLIHPCPGSGMNALFSAPYAVVAALADGRIDLASFTDSQVMREGLRAKFGRVVVAERSGPPLSGEEIGLAPVTVTVTTQDGRRLSKRVVDPPGSPLDPLSPEQQREKWIDCLLRAGAARQDAGDLFDRGVELPRMNDVEPWFACIRRHTTTS